MTKDVSLILNWSSYLIHCLALTILILVFAIPYWYVSAESVDGMEIAGLWVRCRVGGSCRPVHDSLDPLKVNLKPVQALMTVSLILSLVTFALYSVWLWKGEGCATPWRKRCVWCRETYVRSKKPTEEEALKFGRLKWLAFSLATISGVFTLIAAIFFMVQLMQVEGLKPGNIGWAAWLALSSAVIIIFQHGVISLLFYVLKRPDLGHLPSDGQRHHREDEDVSASEEIDDKELERIRKWILEQRRGVENRSFEGDSRQPDGRRENPRRYRARSLRSRARNPSIFYSWRAASSSSLSSASTNSLYRVPRLVDSEYLRRSSWRRPDKHAQYVPAYSVIFKDKIPMIPKEDFSPRSRYVYDVIYHGNRIPRPRYGVDVRRDVTRHRGQSKDDVLIRTMSDPELNLRKSETGQGRLCSYSGAGAGDVTMTSIESAPIPQAYRRRRRHSRRSTSSLPALTSSEYCSHVRTKYPESETSTSGEEISRDVGGLDLTSSIERKKFHLDNIWVVPSREHIGEAIGRRQVHFNLEQSIQELDEIQQQFAS